MRRPLARLQPLLRVHDVCHEQLEVARVDAVLRRRLRGAHKLGQRRLVVRLAPRLRAQRADGLFHLRLDCRYPLPDRLRRARRR